MHAQGIALPPLFLLFAPARGAPPGARRANGAMVQAETRQASPDDARRSAWMAAAQAGDQAAYGALLRDCVGAIERIARRRGVPAEHRDDRGGVPGDLVGCREELADCPVGQAERPEDRDAGLDDQDVHRDDRDACRDDRDVGQADQDERRDDRDATHREAA